MSAFRLITGRDVPSGPLALGIPTGGPRSPRQPRPRQNFRTKKGYTGSRAGLGRLPNGTVLRSGPKGPARFAGSVLLPRRMQHLPPQRPVKQPSLFARVRQRMRRAAAAIGF